MDAKTLKGAKRMTRKEFWAESDRFLEEAQGFLAAARHSTEESRKIAAENQRLIEELEQQLFQPEISRKDNELLWNALQHERELRERDIENLKLELRLQISEELRRLPPSEKK